LNRGSAARSGLLLVLAGIAGLGGSALLARRRSAAGAEARQQAVEIARAVDDGVGALKADISQELETAADIPQFRAALGNRADAVTFLDLFEKEEWWDRFRSRACAVVVGDEIVVTQKFDSGAAAEGLRRARGTVGASVQALEAHGQLHLVAINNYRLARLGTTFTLMLGRPMDRAVLEKLHAGPIAALALSDGRRIRTSTGDGELGAVASTLVGREGEASFVGPDADWTAAAVPVADKLWVVALGRRPAPGIPLEALIAGAALSALLILIGAVVMARGRRAAPAVEQPVAPGAPAAGAPPLATPVERAPATAHPHSPLALVTPGRPTLSTPTGGAGALALATALAAEGGQQFGRYRLMERIGEGGMAEVFTAVLSGAEGFERQAVIKRLRPHLALNPEAVAQFIDEAKLGSVLTHSNIVTVSDFGKVGDGYFLAEEFVDGRTLAQIASRYHEKYGRTLPAALVYHIIHEVLAGIAYAHERMDAQGRPLGIVHRDVSPTNIMVSFEGEVKLLDFGIVKATERVSKTREGNVKGNVGYMSPEQARGLDVSSRSDLFSLGLVMFELLTGEPFYAGSGAGEVLYQAATGPTAEHLGRIARLPSPAPDLLRRALASDPGSRYASARAFAQALMPSATMVKGQLTEMMRALFSS